MAPRLDKKKVPVSPLIMLRLYFTSLHSRPPAPAIPTSTPQPSTQPTSIPQISTHSTQLNSAPLTSINLNSTSQTSTQQTSTCRQSHFIQPMTFDSDVSTLNSLLDFFGMSPRQQEAPHISAHSFVATRTFTLDPQFHTLSKLTFPVDCSQNPLAPPTCFLRGEPCSNPRVSVSNLYYLIKLL